MVDAELLTVSQAADVLNTSTQTIRNWIRANRLHGVRIGNRFLIPRSEVEQLRGGLSVVRGEGPWDFDGEGPGGSLPRAGERGQPDDSAESVLGG